MSGGNKQRMAKPKKKIVASPLRQGGCVFIRTVTNYYTGRIVLLTKDEVVLDDVAWMSGAVRLSTCASGSRTCLGSSSESRAT